MVNEDLDTCNSLQEDEITVLESIYPSLITLHKNPTGKPGRLLTLSIPISLHLSTRTLLSVRNTDSNPSGAASTSTTASPPSLNLLHLPPLHLRLVLPPTYPLYVPPQPISLRASISDGNPSEWLNKSVLKSIKDRLATLWEEEKEGSGEGMGIIWKWWDWVGSGEFLGDLGLIYNGELFLPVPPMLPPSSFHTLLKTYNAGQLHSSFENTAFSCTICLENRKGKSCIEMPGCGCVFCLPCLNSCWSLAITEGSLENVSCPSITCVKSRATRDPRLTQDPGESQQDVMEPDGGLVESVVGNDLKIRWEKLKERRKAEIDPSYTICPRPSCQASVPPPPQPTALDLEAQSIISKHGIRLSDISNPSTSTLAPLTPPATPSSPAIAEDRWARYRCCPICSFSFCLYCSATWHGPHTRCAFPSTNLIVQEYLSYPENSEERRRMEIKKGKDNLKRLIEKFREDEENRRWLEEKTRACAGCGVRVEKSHGCNHMTCGRCSAHFCYRCGRSISPQDPYSHYRRLGTPCFEKLFDQEEIDRFNRETEDGGPGNDWDEFGPMEGGWFPFLG